MPAVAVLYFFGCFTNDPELPCRAGSSPSLAFGIISSTRNIQCVAQLHGHLKYSATTVLQTDQKGVLIRRIEPTAPVNTSLKKGDILLSFDGVDIANDGTVPFRSGERISFNYLVSRKYTNEEVSLPLCPSCRGMS